MLKHSHFYFYKDHCLVCKFSRKSRIELQLDEWRCSLLEVLRDKNKAHDAENIWNQTSSILKVKLFKIFFEIYFESVPYRSF